MEQKYMNHRTENTEIIINKSRFIGYIKRTETEEEAKAFIAEIKAKHKDATHNCSAYIIGASALIQKADDDGEPSGTAGVPILEVLKRELMYNVTVVVTRYFGGIKLGAGGLIRAYSGAAAEVVQSAGKVYEVEMVPVTVTMDYTYTSKFEHAAQSSPHIIKDTAYTDKVTYTVHTRTEDLEDLYGMLDEITQGTHSSEDGDVLMAENVLT
ncbi:YigZ family protein [Salinicoccus halitifaciens]|uniref:YigZ family protein n=1 Tax=Salinicoccus halitifaciens TaxID=1073415 RepID=A0ABV2ECR1_9STAP|nr:YigZ family protein [Salinicoccus halitifaciens]MCD2138865.1 YigZ family protein [Salinicoccus halitifaciens]